MKYFVVEPCTTSNSFEIKLKNKKLNLSKAGEIFSGSIVASTPLFLLVKLDNRSISIYSSGRMMVKSTKRLNSKSVNVLADEIVKKLEKAGALI